MQRKTMLKFVIYGMELLDFLCELMVGLRVLVGRGRRVLANRRLLRAPRWIESLSTSIHTVTLLIRLVSFFFCRRSLCFFTSSLVVIILHCACIMQLSATGSVFLCQCNVGEPKKNLKWGPNRI